MSTLIILSPLLLAWLAAPVTALAGRFRTDWAPWTGALMAALAFAAALWGWQMGGGMVIIPWAASWDLNLAFQMDGLALLYTLLATGIGMLILIYSRGYLPHHLSEEGQPAERSVSFIVLILFFMASMVGMVMAQDLLLLFVFWELTTIASYLLIGFDSHKEESRRAALMALLVTGITSLFFLIGALLLQAQYQTFLIPELLGTAQPGTRLTIASGLIVLAALAKSAQAPFHFWLPRAMAAPTPVSAYLHSAAMVAAGVFLLSRIHPLLRMSEVLLDALIVIGMVSMIMGGLFALKEIVLKRVLAYSTIAQYGYVVFMLGLGTSTAVIGASFYVLAHALMKSGLFLTAGAVTQATGKDELPALGGLRHSLPWLAAGSGVVAAGLAGLPLTMGFFKDEVLFKAALEKNLWFGVAAVLNAVLTLAYTWRFWSGIFLGKLRTAVHHVPWTVVAPVVLLAAAVLLGGTWVTPFEQLAVQAASSAWREPVSIDLAYHLDARPENIMALSVYLFGALLVMVRPTLQRILEAFGRGGDVAGPEYTYSATSRWLDRGSGFLYNFELHDLANRIATILIPTAILLLLGLWVTPKFDLYRISPFQPQDIPLALALLLTALSAVIVALPKYHVTQVLVLSSVNFGLAGVFAFIGAPNLALVGVLVGVVSPLIFVAVFTLFPRDALRRAEDIEAPAWRTRRDLFVGLLAGSVAFLVVWGVLSHPSFGENVADKYMELAPAAHASDVVTAILADWRGLDTMGEITVLAIILVGVGSYLRLWRRG
ncbi:MAG: oxidoreductase [Chloroflexota bacterium]|nr:oxidoreductase [Chloroflexota bacterium]